jgi:hypothetical protein
MARNLFCVLFVYIIELGCGNLKSDYNDDIENAKVEQDTKITNLMRGVDSCFVKSMLELDTTSSAKLRITYNNILESTKYVDSLRQHMNNLNTLDVSNIEIVKQEFKREGLFDSVLNKTNNAYLLIKEATQNNNRKLAIDSTVNELKGKFRNETFDAWPPIAMSTLLFDIESNLLLYSNSCSVIK